MKYLCLVYQDETRSDFVPDSACDAIAGEVLEQREELQLSGHLIVSSSLQSPHATTTVRVRGGKVSISDGPNGETKDHLCGFYLIEARDLNDAIRVTSKMPSARHGCIEIRPVQDQAQR